MPYFSRVDATLVHALQHCCRASSVTTDIVCCILDALALALAKDAAAIDTYVALLLECMGAAGNGLCGAGCHAYCHSTPGAGLAITAPERVVLDVIAGTETRVVLSESEADRAWLHGHLVVVEVRTLAAVHGLTARQTAVQYLVYLGATPQLEARIVAQCGAALPWNAAAALLHAVRAAADRTGTDTLHPDTRAAAASLAAVLVSSPHAIDAAVPVADVFAMGSQFVDAVLGVLAAAAGDARFAPVAAFNPWQRLRQPWRASRRSWLLCGRSLARRSRCSAAAVQWRRSST